MLTLDQAGPLLGMIIGGGGVSGIVAAVFGYLKAARQGRPPQDVPTIAIGGPEGPSAAASAIALAAIASHLARLTAIAEIDAEQRAPGRDFRSQVDGRAMLIIKDDIRGHD